MEIEQSTEAQGTPPQWLGSLVRRGEDVAAQAAEPVFSEEDSAQWLGSVARREEAETAAASAAAAQWTGSSERSALFTKPVAAAPVAPLSEPAPVAVPVPVAPTNLHELPGRERIVMGALGMTLRVAA